MGDVADMILDGILDEETGEWLGEAVGYPRRASDIHRTNDYLTFPGKRKAKIPPNKAKIWNFFNQKGLPFESQKNVILRAYSEHKQWDVAKILRICNKIWATKESWLDFRIWFNEQYKKQ